MENEVGFLGGPRRQSRIDTRCGSVAIELDSGQNENRFRYPADPTEGDSAFLLLR